MFCCRPTGTRRFVSRTSSTTIEDLGGPGRSGAIIGLAGNLVGDVNISGKLTVTSGIKMFHIDHPLDPENKYLNHVAVESAEVLNVHSGNITTDKNGDAVVTMPAWFEALNRDFRYQLTVVGTFAQAIIASKIKGNRFAIKTNAPNVEVSWQVTGVRSDPRTRKFPLTVEEVKSERERGYYLNPTHMISPKSAAFNGRATRISCSDSSSDELKPSRSSGSNRSERPKAISRFSQAGPRVLCWRLYAGGGDSVLVPDTAILRFCN